MAVTWKKIATDNLASGNLTQESSPRLYDINGTSNILMFKNGITKFGVSDNTDRFLFDPANKCFKIFKEGEIQFRDSDDNGQYNFKAPATITNGDTLTIEWPEAIATAGQILEVTSISNGVATTTWIDTPSGSGSGTTINNNADNRVITGSGTANTLEAESGLTFDNSSGQLDVVGRVTAGSHITITANNNSLKGKTSGADVRDLIKCNASGNTEVGNSSEKTLLQGSVIDAQSLELICGTLNAEKIDATPVSSPSAGDLGKGAEVLDVSASQVVVAGKAYYLNSSSTWSGADKDVEAAASGFLVVATGSNANNGMLIRGIISPNSLQGSPSVGDKIYLGDNSTFTSDISGFTAGDFVRVVGHYIATDLIYFNPSQEYIELA